MQKRYAFCSLCLIPFLTLLLASGFSWTGVNFSVIGSRGGRRLAFLVWGALTGNYFYLHTRELIELSGCRNRTLERLLFGALVCFVTAVGIPYLPRQLPGTVFADASEKKRRRIRDTVEPYGPFGNRGLHFAVLHRHHIHTPGSLRDSRRLYLPLASSLQISRACCEICLKNQERSVLQTKTPVLY